MKIQWEHVNYEYDYQEGMWVDGETEGEEQEYPAEESGVEDFFENQLSQQGMRSIAITPFGGYDINDAFSPLKGFEMWIGHTDFSLTMELAEKIESVEGVELFTLMTRYRFCVGVAKMFSFSDVRRNIESSLGINIEDTLSKEVLDLKESLENRTDDWLIYVSPSGEYVSSTEFQSTHQDVVNKVLNNKEYKNGIILKGKHLSE